MSAVDRLSVFAACFVVCVCGTAKAQTSLEIQSSRPGAAIGETTVGKGFFQFETGFDHLKNDSPERSSQDTWVTEMRYGVNENWEVTSEFDFEKDRSVNEPSEEGISDVELGLKYSFSHKANGLIPALGIRSRLVLPFNSAEFSRKNVAPNFIVASAFEFPADLDLEIDLGFACETDEGRADSFAAVNFSKSVAAGLTLFAEGFHSYEDEAGEINADIGAAYLLTSDIQLDLAGGWSHNEGVTERLVSVGLSWRAQTKSLFSK